MATEESKSKPELLIQVTTSPHCPWCLIGHARLHEVLESQEFKDEVGKYVEPRIQIMPYILDPRLPATSFTPPTDIYTEPRNSPFDFAKGPPSKDEYYSKKFGVPGQLASFSERLNREGLQAGLSAPLVFSGSGKVGATWDAERLLSKAWDLEEQDSSKRGVQSNLSLALYKSFHINSEDISDHNVLADLAVAHEIFADNSAALAWLTDPSEHHAYEVKNKLRQAEMNGIQSVPFYNVNDGADHLSQVGDKESFMRMFKMASALYH
ncbi:unnamed protein product [Parajaminaea phylloscopi]